jgi:hypothetical protein
VKVSGLLDGIENGLTECAWRGGPGYCGLLLEEEEVLIGVDILGGLDDCGEFGREVDESVKFEVHGFIVLRGCLDKKVTLRCNNQTHQTLMSHVLYWEKFIGYFEQMRSCCYIIRCG